MGKELRSGGRGQPGNLVRLDQVNEMSVEKFGATFSGLKGGARAVERGVQPSPFGGHEDWGGFHEAMFGATAGGADRTSRSYPDSAKRQTGNGVGRDPSALGWTEDARRGLCRSSQRHAELPGEVRVSLLASVAQHRSRRSCDNGRSVRCSMPRQERATALIEVGKIVKPPASDLVARPYPIHTSRTAGLEKLGH